MNTTYFLNVTAGNVFGTKADPALPAKYFLGLSATAPNADGTNVTEPTAAEYGRIELTSLSAPVDGVVKNTTELAFEKVVTSEGWGTFTHYAIFDGKSDGNLLMYKELSNPAVLSINNLFRVEIGGLELAATN